MKLIFRLISLIAWIAVAALVLPCVFVSGTIFPAWEKWGQEL